MDVAVFAPATIAISGTLLDSFGFPLMDIGDVVYGTLTDEFEGARLTEILNNPGLPLGPSNVVEAVAQKVWDSISAEHKPRRGIELVLEKHMKVGTGMGSSGASGVAAAVAVNELCGRPFTTSSPELLQAVTYGEFVACGAAHAGNVVPCLVGGPVFIFDDLEHVRIKTPTFHAVLVSPDLVVTTREARKLLWETPYDFPLLIKRTHAVLKRRLSDPSYRLAEADWDGVAKDRSLAKNVHQYMTGGLEVCHGFLTNDIREIGAGLEKDGLVTPVRGTLIKHFADVKAAAKDAGASAFCISGSGPAMFALADSAAVAEQIGDAMIRTFSKHDIAARKFVSQIDDTGARVLSSGASSTR